ncbi:tyrosine-type recombinase/integrase [Shouchella miscanthi]|uniref:tyrosine-type recombinase/integrase n=1 Tax=Shouchella miscanthi TaxID=2598861 RepID=UPI0011A11852|nr:tyrosine-type recombinase/integrase [Shouchella miscanthi]
MYFETVTLKSGQTRWVAMADGPADPVTGKRKQIARRGKTKKEAKLKVEKEIAKREDSGFSSRQLKSKTFDRMAEEWIATYALSGKKRGSVRIREKDINVLNRSFAKVPIDRITHSVYQKFINMLPERYSLNSIKSINGTAGMIFKYALREQLIKHNPNDGVSIPKQIKTVEDIKKDPVEEKYLDHDELNLFFEALTNNALELDMERFYTLAFSGMRPGELCALQKEDLDFQNNTISIYKTLYNENNNMKSYELNTPKTIGSIRTIEMEESVMKMLKSLVRSNDERKMRLRTKHDDFHDKDFVFCRPNGYPYVTKNVADRMERLINMTNITKHATPHIFRHTHISMLTEAKVDLPTIMERVGHEDVATTMKVYTHVTKKMKKDAPAQVSNLHENIIKKISS